MRKFHSAAVYNQNVMDFCSGSHLSILSFIDKYTGLYDITVWSEQKEVLLMLEKQDTQSLMKAMQLSIICPTHFEKGV